MRRALPSLSTTARHEIDAATPRRTRASLGIRSGHATASLQQPLHPTGLRVNYALEIHKRTDTHGLERQEEDHDGKAEPREQAPRASP
jgi:hypothetical protein